MAALARFFSAFFAVDGFLLEMISGNIKKRFNFFKPVQPNKEIESVKLKKKSAIDRFHVTSSLSKI